MCNVVEQVRAIPEQESIYQSLNSMELYEQSSPVQIYVQTNQEKIKQVVLGILGDGGSKRAYELEGGTALLMPQGRSLSSMATSKEWSEMVDEEIVGTRRVAELGLLACQLEKIKVYMTNDSSIGVTAYRTETFSQLSARGIWIIDQKKSSSTTWKRSFFQEASDALDEKKWKTLLRPFLRDIAKLFVNGFDLYIDNVNMAVVEKSNQDNGVKYEIRYFGFDFSSKEFQLSFKKKTFEEIDLRVPYVVSDALRCVMDLELGHHWSEYSITLFQALKESSIKEVLSEVKQYVV
jgi:hypothetical protein